MDVDNSVASQPDGLGKACCIGNASSLVDGPGVAGFMIPLDNSELLLLLW